MYTYLHKHAVVLIIIIIIKVTCYITENCKYCLVNSIYLSNYTVYIKVEILLFMFWRS